MGPGGLLAIVHVQFNSSAVSDSLRPHGLQHSRLPCPSPLPELTQTHVHRVGDTIQPSHPVVPFSSHLQSFLASGFFQVSQFFTSGGQSIKVSASLLSILTSYLDGNLMSLLYPLKLDFCLVLSFYLDRELPL